MQRQAAEKQIDLDKLEAMWTAEWDGNTASTLRGLVEGEIPIFEYLDRFRLDVDITTSNQVFAKISLNCSNRGLQVKTFPHNLVLRARHPLRNVRRAGEGVDRTSQPKHGKARHLLAHLKEN